MKALLKLHSECLDYDIGQVFIAFDKYCDDNFIRYSIECDERNEQSYLVLKHDLKIDALTEYMKNYIEGRSVVMDTDRNRRDGVLYHFATKPIVDSIVDVKATVEDEYKTPTNKMIRDQSMFPQSFNNTRSFGGITKADYKNKRKKPTTFSDKLDDRLASEEVIGLSAPEVLVTLTNGPTPNESSGTRTVVYTIQASENDHTIIDQLLKSLENGGNGITGSVRVSKNEPESQPTVDATTTEPEISCMGDLGTKLTQLLNMDIGI